MQSRRQQSLTELGRYLLELGYRFTTITPESHRRVLERPALKGLSNRPAVERALKDLLGWSKAVSESTLPPKVVELLKNADLVTYEHGELKSLVRFSTLGNSIFVHSAYPTVQRETVFFGPDSYRFVRFVKEKVESATGIVDLGCGSGVGGICLAQKFLPSFDGPIYLVDINETALEFATVNAAVNGAVTAHAIKSNLFSQVPPGADVVIANPPFMMDEKLRAYRHGGGDYGSELPLRMISDALDYLKPGGTLALFTGACVVDGEDMFHKSVRGLLSEKLGALVHYDYVELDPDIYGEELSHPLYAEVDRMAAVGLTVHVG